ncbi:MAG TPA: RidA family protein [Polyangia bacterium]
MNANQIARLGPGKRWSDIVVFNRTMYVVEVPTNLDGDITVQTRDVLASLEDSLAQGKSGKDRLLLVTIFLADLADIDGFNAVWDAWLPPGAAPVRACVGAKLANPRYRVELQVTAALAD